MNSLLMQTKDASANRAPWLAAMMSVSILLAACSGDGVDIASGQRGGSDPVVVDYAIAYIKAPLPLDEDGEFEEDDLREQITFEFGADVYYRDQAAPGAEEINITGQLTQGMAAIRDLEMAFDGSNVVFAMRYPFDPNVDEEDLPTWNIWKYTFASGVLERVIKSTNTAEIGHDIMPKYLPDGRLIFSSTRQTQSQATMIDEGKEAFIGLDEDQNEYAFNLHMMNEDGSGVVQLTFNQSHDLDPAVLSNGQIVFSRWDNMAGNNAINLYRMNPDGSMLELLYGQQSHNTGTNGQTIQFTQPRELEDGRIMVLARPFSDTAGGGELVVIDTPQYLENQQPTAPNIGVLNGPAQEDATVNAVSTIPDSPSPGGRFRSVYPILDGTGRLLVSWSQCRIKEILVDDGDPETDDYRIHPCTDDLLAQIFVQPDPDNPIEPPPGSYVEADPLYGVWMYDPRDDTQRPVVIGEEGFHVTEVVAADPTLSPVALPDGMNDFALANLASENVGVLNIRSVYDFDGVATVNIPAMADPGQTLAADRPARFLRIEKAVSIPDEDATNIEIDNTAFGVNNNQGMREIVGYAMIEPDGSVMTKVPANVALAISIVDENGKRFGERHQNWLHVRPGQELSCNGCHVSDSGLSHGRYDAFDSAYAGAPAGALEFPGTLPQWSIGEPGETMAEVRARVTCANTVNPCSSLEPSVNVWYTDVWTADPLIAIQNQDIDYRYTASGLTPGLSTQSPTTFGCETNWEALCRVIINYESIIHPLWSLPRPAFEADGVTPILDPATGLQVDNMCIGCHTIVNPADGTAQLAAGQLELTDGLSPDEPDHFHAYRELLAGDNLQVLMDGAVVDALQQVDVDIDGNPIFDVIPIGSPASANGAAASGDFFNRFEDPAQNGTVDHSNFLNSAEKRLIAEWLDVGAQYYNNPYDVPQ